MFSKSVKVQLFGMIIQSPLNEHVLKCPDNSGNTASICAISYKAFPYSRPNRVVITYKNVLHKRHFIL